MIPFDRPLHKQTRGLVRSIMLVAALGGAQAALAQSANGGDAHRFGPSLDGKDLTCPQSFSQLPNNVAMREAVLRPDPDFKMPVPPGGFEGDEFKKIMAGLRDRLANDWADLCHYRGANADLKARVERPRMVLMGDSITENWVAAHPDFFAHGFVGRGISGQTSPQMLARFYADVVALRPGVVQIMAGTNDIGGNTGPNLLSDYENNINAMIDLAQANKITVILAAIPPITMIPTKPAFDPRPSVDLINAKLKDIAARRKLTFVDYFSVLAGPDKSFDRRYANEGIHPNRDGYSLMEPLLRKAFSVAVRKPGR